MAKNQNVTAFPTSKRERKRLLRRSKDIRLRVVSVFRAMTGWLLMVAAIGFIAINYRLFTPDSMRRVASYAQVGLTAAPGDLTTIEFTAGSAEDAVLYGGGLAVADSDTLYVAKPGGMTQLTLQLSYSSIVLDTAGEYILAYDRGGTGLTVTNALAPLFQTQLSSPILSASLSESGSFAVVSDETGYRSAVTVFTADGRQTYKWSSSEYYVQSAALSPSGKRLAALAFRMNGTALESRLLFFNIGDEEIASEYTIGTPLGLEVRFLSESTVAALCDSGLFLVDRAGKLSASQEYAASDLIGFSVSGDAVALATRSYTRSARSEVSILRENGKTTGPLYLTEELQSLSLANGKLGLLTSAGLHLYDDAMQPLWSDTAASGGRRLLLADDGTAFVLFGKNARLFTQNHTEEPAHAIDLDAGTADPGDAAAATVAQ